MPGISLFFFFFLYFEPGADKLRRVQGALVGGVREGIGDYSQPIDGVATETRKSVSPSFVCWWSLSLFMWVSVEKYSSSGSSSASRLMCFFFFVLCQNTALQWKSRA